MAVQDHSDQAPQAMDGGIIEVRDLEVGFGDVSVLNGLDLSVRRGEILGVVGASGTGKSVLLRAILGLNPRRRGTVDMLGAPYSRLDDKARAPARPAARRSVSARCPVFLAQRASERSGSHARALAIGSGDHEPAGHGQARYGRTA